MLDMGFIRDIRRILALLPARRQNLLFSATFSSEIRSLADGLLDRPVEVAVAPRNAVADLVRQLVHPVDRERKRELLRTLIVSRRLGQTLVFTRTKHGASRLGEQLARDGIATAVIHGDKGQGQRTRALADFKAGRVMALVATDVAARGLDIDALPHVVNFELPMVPQDYVHRIGRTGRAGAVGEAISLVCIDEAPLLRDIERLLGRPVPAEVVVGFEPNRSIPSEPIRLRSTEPRANPGRSRRLGAPASLRPVARHAGPAGAPSTAAGRRSAGAAASNQLVALPGERFARGRPSAPRARGA
jgi:ATP-dependent RNA helicase RhlE